MMSLYGLCIILSVVVFLVNKIKRNPGENALMSASMLNSRAGSLVCIFLLCIGNFFFWVLPKITCKDTVIYYVADPEGFDHSSIPLWFRDIIYMMLYPILVTMFSIILTNW
jgi:hypothetical protein